MKPLTIRIDVREERREKLSSCNDWVKREVSSAPCKALAANLLRRVSPGLYSIGEVHVLEEVGLYVSEKEEQFVSYVG